MNLRNRIISFAATSVVAGLLMTPQAHAQASCPTGTANPLTVLTGTWTYDMGGQIPTGTPFAAAGQFTASIRTVGGVQVGSLTITQSSTYARLETDSGSYTIFPDCSGGTLTFYLSLSLIHI